MDKKIPRSISHYDANDIRSLYASFDSAITSLDCGGKCSAHNSSGKPFCCDICHAVPSAYESEWAYLRSVCNMVLLACLGPALCQREYRALSCRQFPFFPYVTSDYQFVGLVYEWAFESNCWVVSNLARVTKKYRNEFVRTFDEIFARFQDEFENYAFHSERMRVEFVTQGRRIPLLHRNGGYYLLSPRDERMRRISPDRLHKFGPYR